MTVPLDSLKNDSFLLIETGDDESVKALTIFNAFAIIEQELYLFHLAGIFYESFFETIT